MPDMEPETKDILQQKLDILKKNREQIPVRQLIKGKYAKAYSRLLQEIGQLAKKSLSETCRFAVPEDGLKIALEALCTGLSDQRLPIQKALYKNYSADEFISICEQIHRQTVSTVFDSDLDWNGEKRYPVLK